MRLATGVPGQEPRFYWAFSIVCTLLALSACSGEGVVVPEDREPAELVILGGDGQADTVGRALRDSLVVRLTDRDGRPVMHEVVRFLDVPGQPDARAIPDPAETDADGRARVLWVLGTVAGPATIRAQVAATGRRITAEFHAAAIAAAPDIILATAGDRQSGVVGGDLSQPLVATARDRYGNPVSGVTGTWSTVGGGSVNPVITVTDSNGQITVRRTLGSSPGEQRTLVTAPGLTGSPVSFVHSAIPGQPASLIAESGNGQSGSPGQPLTDVLAVRLVDAVGNGIPGRAVAWSVAAGGGTITPSSNVTDAGGRASAALTLGSVPGTNIVISSSSGFTATLTATSTATLPTTIAASSPTQLTGAAGGSVSPAPSVRVTDAQGRPVGGILVTFAVGSGGGSVAPTTTVTDANGSATAALWTLGSLTGANTLSVSASGASGALSGSPVWFTAVAAAGTMSRLAMVTQPSPLATSGVPLARPPAVQLQDAFGNDVGGSGVVVTATIAGSPAGASLSSTVATTNSAGIASFTGLTLVGPAATYTLLFTVPGLASVTSDTIAVRNSGPTQTISILVQPSTTVANGALFPVQPSVRVLGQDGLPVSGVSVGATVASGGATLGGQLITTTDALGIAAFSNLQLTGTVGSYSLRLSASASSVTTTTISLTPGPASASQSTATVPSRGRARHQTVIAVRTRDQSGNALKTGGYTVEITVTGANPVGRFTATDKGDGSYTASYTPTKVGMDLITITLDGTPIAGSPYSSDVH